MIRKELFVDRYKIVDLIEKEYGVSLNECYLSSKGFRGVIQ